MQVAKGAVHAFNPAATVTALHANVKGAEFNVEYFKGFDVVMNALDNVSARRWLGRVKGCCAPCICAFGVFDGPLWHWHQFLFAWLCSVGPVGCGRARPVS